LIFPDQRPDMKLNTLSLFAITVLWAGVTHAAVIRRVAGPGDPVPGIPGATYSSADYPEFDPQGNIRYLGRIIGPQVTWENHEGFWRQNATSGQTELIMRVADPLRGSSDGATIKHWFAFGHGLALVGLTGPTVDARSDIALLNLGTGTARTIARESQAVPGFAAGTQFDHVDTGGHDRSEEHTIFQSQLVGPGINVENDSGLWIGSDGDLRQVVREGDLVPGLQIPFREFTGESVDRFGRAVFTGHFYSDDPLVRRYEQGIYFETNGQLEELLRTGTQAPGLPAGVQIEYLHSRINLNGHLTVHAELLGHGMDPTRERAVYVDRGNGVELIAREGEEVRGLPDVIWNGSEGHFPTRHDALLSVRSESGEEWQLLSTGWERLRPNPQHGDPAPGTTTTFTHINWSMSNSLGQRAFLVNLENDDDNPHNDRGIWADDEHGVLQLVIREGDLVETSRGLLEPLDLENLYSQLHGFNDRGEILFTAHDGVYVATVSAIPEPGTLVLTIASGVILLWIAGRARSQR
jgi:hypothetical protein